MASGSTVLPRDDREPKLGCWLWRRSPSSGARISLRRRRPKEICRELKVSRKVVRKVVRSGATEFVYERKVQPQPKIGPWREDLDRLLG